MSDRRAGLEPKRYIEPLAYLAPFLIILIVFTIYPVFNVFRMSFMNDYNFITGAHSGFGLENYASLFSDPYFLSALRNTFIYVVWVVPVGSALSLLFAILLNKELRFTGFFQTVYFLPLVTSIIAVGLVWKWMYNFDYGLFNYLLKLLGLNPINWLNDPEYALAALIIYGTWSMMPFTIILFLSGLQAIDETYFTVARLDGAGSFRIFRRITLPLLSPTIALVIIINVINSSKVFTELYPLFNGKPGPAYSLYTVVFYIFDMFFNKWKVELAAAASIVLFLIVFLFTCVQLYLQKKWVSLS
jgi:multiple sugar transport system permease protein